MSALSSLLITLHGCELKLIRRMITQKCGRILMKFYGLTDCMTEIKFLTFGNDLGYNPSTNSEDHGS